MKNNCENFEVCIINAFSDIAALMISTEIESFSNTICIYLPITLLAFVSHIF